MSDFVPRVRRGAHRPQASPLRGLVPLLVALLAVVLVGVGLALYRPGGIGSTEPAPKGASTGPTGGAAAGQPGSSGAAPPPGPAAGAPTTPSGAGPTARTALRVTVLNSTRRGGLGGIAAERLRDAGWRVSSVSTFRRGAPTVTTVYYPAGYEGLARRLAAELPVPAQVQQRPSDLSSVVRSDRLTVVVATDYPRS